MITAATDTPETPALCADLYRATSRVWADRLVQHLHAEAAAVQAAVDVAFAGDQLVTAGMAITEAGRWERLSAESCRAHLAHHLQLATLWAARAGKEAAR